MSSGSPSVPLPDLPEAEAEGTPGGSKGGHGLPSSAQHSKDEILQR